MPLEMKKLTRDMASAIRKRRKALGLTQEQLSRFADCGVAYLYLLETGKPTVRLDKLVSVLGALGLQLRLESGKEGLRVDEKLK